MPNKFTVFDSDAEDDVVPVVPKKTTKPKTLPKTTKPMNIPKEAPKAVAQKDRGAKKPFKKKEVMEPSDKPQSYKNKESRGPGRGVKPGDTDARGKRYNDRQSGTGRDRGMKKGGEGSHNWGGTGNSTKYNTNVSLSMDQSEKAEEEVPAVTEGEEKKEEEEPKEPEKETFTFEQFLEKKKEKRVGEAFVEKSSVKVEEVEGRSYAKKDRDAMENQDVFIKAGTEKVKRKKEKVGGKKLVQDLGFKVYSPDEGRFSARGGRRGGRGGYRGGGRTYQQKGKSGLDTTDAATFPSLGAS